MRLEEEALVRFLESRGKRANLGGGEKRHRGKDVVGIRNSSASTMPDSPNDALTL